MPTIRNKLLQSRRVGSALNGLGEFDQTDWSGDYSFDPVSGWTGDVIYAEPAPQVSFTQVANTFTDLFKRFTQPQPTQQPVQYTGTAAQPARPGINPLLIAAGLAAVAIVAWPKSRR